MEQSTLPLLKGAYLSEADIPRLTTKARRVWEWMMLANGFTPDGQPATPTSEQQSNLRAISLTGHGWIELNALSQALRMPHSTITACVRAFRYDENGGHTVEVRRPKKDEGPYAGGTFLYRLIPSTPEAAAQARARAAARAAGTERPAAYHEGMRDARLQVLGQIKAMVSSQYGWPNSPALKELTDTITGWVETAAGQTKEHTHE